MKADLAIHLAEETLLNVTEAQSQLAKEVRQNLAAQDDNLEGILSLRHDGQPTIEIHDDLEILIQRLCFNALAKLKGGEAVTIDMFTSTEALTLKPHGDVISITTTWDVAAQFPAAELLAEFLLCGENFIRFVEENFSDIPAWQENISNLKLGRDLAKQ